LPYYTGLARRMVHTCLLASLRLTERLALSAAEGVGGVSSLCTKLFRSPTSKRMSMQQTPFRPQNALPERARGASGVGRLCHPRM
jgi:hypothetical protein